MRIHPDSEYARKIQAEQEARKIKIVVCVDGGVVQSVYANHDINVVIVDHDNLREDFDRDQREMIEETAIADLKEQPEGELDTSLSIECSDCNARVKPDADYYGSQCGTFCDECMIKHAEKCDVCANEFELGEVAQ